MVALALLPVAVAFAVLAAHFYRAGRIDLALGALALIALLFVPRAWAARALQVGLVAGALEWLHTLASLVALRQSMGEPYVRLALILGAVAFLTALTALVFRDSRVRTRFGLLPRPAQ
jgi:hypothetical protein